MPPKRRSLAEKSAALKIDDQNAKSDAGSQVNIDRHAAMAVVINSQIETNQKLKTLFEKINVGKEPLNLSFITENEVALTEVRDSLLNTVEKRTKNEACCSAMPLLDNSKPGEINGKNFKCFIYSGDPPVPSLCHQWLDRFNIACEGKTEKQWFSMLKMYSEGNLLSTLSAWESEGHKTPKVIIPWIERMFGGLIPPHTARRRLSLLERKPNETVTALDVRITALAKMATLEDPLNVRTMNLDMLRKATLLRVVPTIIKNDFLERELARVERGDDEFSYRDTVHELQFIAVKYQDSNSRKVNLLEADSNPITHPDSDPEEFIETKVENELDGDEYDDQINYLGTRGKVTSRRFKGNYQKRGNERRKDYHRRSGRVYRVTEDAEANEGVAFACDEDLLKYDDDTVFVVKTADGRGARIYSAELNVEKDACFKCGRQGHKMYGPGSEFCPYKNEPLQSRCTTCNCGGHRPDICKSKN